MTLIRRLNVAWVFAFAVLVAFGYRTISTYGLWLHLATGRWMVGAGIPRADPFSFAVEGQPWVNYTWLYDLVAYALHELGGPPLLTLAHIASVGIAYGLLTTVARRWASATPTALALVHSAWLLAPVFSPSPALFTLVFPALMLWATGAGLSTRRLWWLLLPAQWAWSNMHTAFLLGPMICLLRALEPRGVPPEEGADDTAAPNRLRRAPLVALAAGCLAVTVLQPYGLGLHRQAVLSWFNVGFVYVNEWISPFSWMFLDTLHAAPITLALIVGAAGVVVRREKLPLTVTALTVFGAALVVLRPRLHNAFFAAFAYPFLALSLSAASQFIREQLSSVRWLRAPALPAAGPILAVVLAGGSILTVTSNYYYRSVGSASAFGLGAEYDAFPDAAAEIIARPDFPARAVNLASDGGYLLWKNPTRKIFVDQRANLYGPLFYQAIADAFNGDMKRLDRFEERWTPEAFLINGVIPGAAGTVRQLLHSGRWAMIYFDGTTAVLVRKFSRHANLLNSARIHRAGNQILDQAASRYRDTRRAGAWRTHSPRLIGAARVFLELEYYWKALELYGLLVNHGQPTPSSWLGKGACHLALEQNQHAVRTLEEASRQFDDNAKVWLWLSRAYVALGRIEPARNAYRRAAQIDPTLATHFGDPLARKEKTPFRTTAPSLPGLLPETTEDEAKP